MISLFVMFIFSCTPLKCMEETEAYLNISFYYTSTNKPLTPDSVIIFGLNRESDTISTKTKDLTMAQIPLNNAADNSEFIVIYHGISDTVKFIYSSFPHLISKECGYTYYHTLDTTRIFTLNAIKNMKVWNGNITNLNEENIRISY